MSSETLGERWVVNPDPDTGRPLEIALASDRDMRVAFLSSDGTEHRAALLAAAPALRDALLWCVAFDGECLADHPAKRAEFEALLLATQEESDA